MVSRLTPGKETRYPLNVRMGGPPEPVWKFRRREKSLTLAGVRTPDRPSRSLAAIQTELSPTMMIMTTIISILLNKLPVLEKAKARQKAVAIRNFCVIQITEMNEMTE